MKTFIFFVLSFIMFETNFPSTSAQTTEKPKLNVAILIFDGVQIIDYTGPYEVLGSWKRRNVFTVAEKSGLVKTNMNMLVEPNYSFENHPKIDILVIPGGGNSTPGANGRGVGKQLDNEKVIRWIQDNAKDANYVLSVCNGAFLIGKAGLLAGLEATTTAGMIKDLKNFAPTAKLVYDKRFTDNGKIITTAGLSSGIDGALHLVEKLDGTGWAKRIAMDIEYNWQPDSDYARAALADRKFPDSIYEPFYGNSEPLDAEGGKDNWESKWLVNTPRSAAELQEEINKRWEGAANWSKLKSDKFGSFWRLAEKDGKTWRAYSFVESVAETGKLVVILKIKLEQKN